MKLKFPYDAVETEDKKMDMFSRKDMVRLFGPLLVEQLLAVLVGMADVVMVAAVGETAVSGVALVDSISVLVIQVLSAMATGGAVVCAQYIGKKRQDQACRAAGQLVLITAVLFSFDRVGGLYRKPSSAAADLWLSRDRGYGQCGNVFLVHCHVISVSGTL